MNQIAILLHCEETINNCLNWLDEYGSWNDFVEKNFYTYIPCSAVAFR